MRLYFKGVALGIALLLVILLVHKHFRTRRQALAVGSGKTNRVRQARADSSANGARPHGRLAAQQAGKRRSAAAPAKALPAAARKSPLRERPKTAGDYDYAPVVSRSPVKTPRIRTNQTRPRQRLQEALPLNPEAEATELQLDVRNAADQTVNRQQELEDGRFGFQPVRGRPKPPEKLADESETWLKDMKYPEWYTESVKRSRVYGKEDFVGGGPLYDGPCPGAEKVKAEYKAEKIRTFSYVEPGEFIAESKNPCWYEDPTKKRMLRCIPYFYVAGVAKCGTTDLYKRIRIHPDIMEGELKEYHWWDRLRYGASMELKFTKDSEKNDSPLPLSEYSRIITGSEIEDLKADLKTQGFSNRICGDGSPSYLWDASQWTIFEGNEGCTEPRIVSGSFIQHAYPEVKILLIFRHPTQRLYSRFLSRIPRYPPFKGATPQMFHDFVVNGIAYYKKCFMEHSIRQCAYNKTIYNEAVVRIVEGMYSVFVKDWLRIFKRDQIMFLRNEDYSEDVEGHIIKVFEFLDVAKLGRSQMRPIVTHVTTNIGQNYEKVGLMLPETIEILNEFYKPFVLDLHKLIGDDQFLWKDIAVT